jgi:hypothetical protein
MTPEKGAKTITLPTAVTKANNRKSISAMQKQGADATRKRKAGWEYPQTRAERLAHQEAEAVIVQDEVGEQFARDVEYVVARRGPGDPIQGRDVESSITVEAPTSSPTPAARPSERRSQSGLRRIE